MIALNREEAIWVVNGLGVASQKIKKHTLNFKAKSWWILAQHRLCPTIGDNVLSPFRSALIVGFMYGYEFNLGEFLARQIRYRAMGREKLLLSYLCMIT